MTRCGCPRAITIWSHYHLDAIALTVSEGIVPLWRILESQPMRDDERGINFTVFNQFQQRAQVLVNVGLAHLESQTLRKRRPKWKLIEKAAIDSGYRNCSAFTARSNCLT